MRNCLPSLAAGLLCVAVAVGTSSTFLPHQSLWGDEATQLAGISLGPSRVVPWLAGRPEPGLNAIEDRMPPLSYWLGWAWSRAFTPAERPMRWLGVAAVGLSALLVHGAARRVWGPWAGLAAGLVFATSPNVVIQAVEIRAYPLLILATSAMLAALVRLGAAGVWGEAGPGARPPVGDLWAIVGLGVAASYLHFFGLVCCGGCMLAALILGPRRGLKTGATLAAIAVVGVCCVGLLPFVSASLGTAAGPAPAVEPLKARLVDAARLLYRLVAHASTSVHKPSLVAAALGLGLSMVAAMAPKRRGAGAATGLAIALGSGYAVVVAARLVQSKFVATNPSYNAWMLPALSMLLASGVAARSRPIRAAAGVGVGLLIAANLAADLQLARRGDYFAHSPAHAVVSTVHRLGDGRATVVMDGQPGPMSLLGYGIFYDLGRSIPQLIHRRGDGSRLGLFGRVDAPEVGLDGVATPYLIVVDADNQGADVVAAQARADAVAPRPDGPVARLAAASGRWAKVEERALPGFVRADVDVFERVGRPPSSPGPSSP